MRIAIDIDSTLHHYWEILSESSKRRFGVELPYEEQLTWGITRLKPKQLEVCIADTHRDEAILAAEPVDEEHGRPGADLADVRPVVLDPDPAQVGTPLHVEPGMAV